MTTNFHLALTHPDTLTLHHSPTFLLEVDVCCDQEPGFVVGHSCQAETARDKEGVTVRNVPIAHLSEREHFDV